MVVGETILQHWIFTRFVLPFLLIFFIVFGILEKTKIFGEDKKQLNAFISFIIGLIFVGAVFPTEVVSNMVLFLTVAVVVMFIALLLWGFVAGEEGLKFENIGKPLRVVILVVIMVAIILALLWALGINQGVFGAISDFLFQQDWSKDLWVNLAFIVVIIIAMALVLKGEKKA